MGKIEKEWHYSFDFDAYVFERKEKGGKGVAIPELPVTVRQDGGASDNPVAESADGALIDISQTTIKQWKALHVKNMASGAKGDESSNKNRNYWSGRLHGHDIRVALCEDWDELAYIRWVDAEQFICSTRVDAFISQEDSLKCMKSLAESLISGEVEVFRCEKNKRLKKLELPPKTYKQDDVQSKR